jgi:peptide/nickel transport system permease protein
VSAEEGALWLDASTMQLTARELEPSAGMMTTLKRLRGDKSAVVGALIVATFAVVAIAAPLVATHDPLAVNPLRGLEGPGRDHLLGTDNLGRDIFSRLVFGSRLSLGTAVLAAAVVLVIGVSVGLIAGLRGGWIDALCMRLVDGLLAFPALIFVLAIAGTLETGLIGIVIGFAVVSWASYARFVRGLVLQVRERAFIEGARAQGASSVRIAARHVLPHVLGPVVVLLSVEMSTYVVAVSGLSFLGVGVEPPTPEWGAMLDEGRRFLLSDPNQMLFPGAAIALVALGFNLVGEALRDALDPRARSSPPTLGRSTRRPGRRARDR